MTVRTIRGDVDTAELGAVLPHEHVLIDVGGFFTEPHDPDGRAVARQPVSLETLGWVRYHHRQSIDNLKLDDPQLQIRELGLFKKAGGRTLVELTPRCAGRDVRGLVEIAGATDLHIVCGSGVYLEDFQDDEVRAMSVEQIAERMALEIQEGIDGTDIRAGIIGEMGCSWPLMPAEDKALRAAARAQRITGASISVHPGRHHDAPLPLLRLLESEGAQLDRVVISHIDRTVDDHQRLIEIAATGCYLEYDLFGQETSYIRYGTVEMPNDMTRIERIAKLIESGLADQILISLDIGSKYLLSSYGGPGYSHILERVVPRMKEVGYDKQLIDRMTIENPARMLSLSI